MGSFSHYCSCEVFIAICAGFFDNFYYGQNLNLKSHLWLDTHLHIVGQVSKQAVNWPLFVTEILNTGNPAFADRIHKLIHTVLPK